MANSLVFYNDLVSQPCRAVYMFMKDNKIPFRSVKVDLMAGEQRQDDFTKISSLQRVPVIEHNGFVFGESAAIFRYLANVYNVPEHWYPQTNVHRQARTDEYLNWHHSNIRMPTVLVFQHQFVNTMRGKRVNEPEVTRLKAELSKAIKYIDTYFLKDNNFIGGNEISVADVQAVCELMQLYGVGDEYMVRSNTQLSEWMDRVKARLQPHFDECHNNTIFRMNEMYLQRKASKSGKL